MGRIFFTGDTEEERRRTLRLTEREEAIQALSPDQAITAALFLLDKPELTKAEALIEMLGEVIERELDGITLYRRWKRSEKFDARAAHIDFRSATWQGSLAKAFLWTREPVRGKRFWEGK